MMRVMPMLDLFNGDRDSTPFALAGSGGDGGAFLSCYLHARAGKQASFSFLNQKAARIRETLHGIDRFRFDSAVEMIRHAMDSIWRPEVRGVALFARGAAGRPQVTVVHTATRVDNRLVYFSLPEVLPLIALLQREPAFDLMHIDGDRIRLFESRLGADFRCLCVVEASRAGTCDDAIDELSASGAGASRLPIPQSSVWQFHKALAASSSPLFITGSAGVLAAAADWLPRRATERLVGTLAVPRKAGLEEVLETAKRRVRTICREEAVRLADAVATDGVSGGYSRLGYRATLQALRTEGAEVVVISDWDHPGLGLPREEMIEVCFEALRRGVRVVLADCLRLRQVGGVGCVLRHSREEAATSSVRSSPGFDRVA